jgi:hypothetical protein
VRRDWQVDDDGGDPPNSAVAGAWAQADSVSVAVELGDRLFGALVVDEGFAVSRGSDERADSGIIERAGQTTAGFVQSGAGVVGDQWIGPSGQRQVMTDVTDRFAQIHRRQLVAYGDALIERGVMSNST